MRAASSGDSASHANRIQWLLRKVELLSAVSGPDLDRLEEQAELLEIPRRQVIYLRGDPGDTVYFVHGGRVKCSKAHMTRPPTTAATPGQPAEA